MTYTGSAFAAGSWLVYETLEMWTDRLLALAQRMRTDDGEPRNPLASTPDCR